MINNMCRRGNEFATPSPPETGLAARDQLFIMRNQIYWYLIFSLLCNHTCTSNNVTGLITIIHKVFYQKKNYHP